MSHRYDAIIIGTGQAGPLLRTGCRGAGMSVAIVERHLFGGTCVNTGCIPTKAMVASAYAAHMARRASDFGVVIDGGVRVDMKRVKARKDAISERSRTGVEQWLRGTAALRRLHRTRPVPIAATKSPSGIRSSRADRIFINVGGRASVPPMPGLDQVPFLTNSSMMDLDTVPPHLHRSSAAATSAWSSDRCSGGSDPR